MLKHTFGRFLLAILLISGCNTDQPSDASLASSEEGERPNILLILVDDLGFADLGSFGGEIETPNLDQLAYGGVRLTNLHVAPTCSPTRAMLLSGVDNHKAGLGNMAEEMAPNQQGKHGYEGYLNERVVPIPRLFQDAGYRTYMVGKWHLGMTEETSPTARGFDRSFALLQGGASHFGDMAPIAAEGPDAKATYRRDGELLEQLPDNFQYSTQFYVDQLIEYLEEDHASDQPFFAYLAFTAPHWPIQAPDTSIEKYKGRYDQGYDWLHQQRLTRQKERGLIPESASANRRPHDALPWSELSEDDKAWSARSMEAYAGMVDEIDVHTGRLIEHLKQRGDLENTLIVFMSDNGAEGHTLEVTWNPEEFPAVYRWIIESHDFSLEAVGRIGSYVMYGPGWGRAGAPAFRDYKGFPTEGGTRVAAFVHYPRVFGQGVITDQLVTVRDIAPTLLDVADIEHPGARYQGKPVEPMTGVSALPILRGDIDGEQAKNRVVGTELFGKRALRQGDWKIVHMPEPHGNGQWQLYNLESDLAENKDLAAEQPEKLAELIALWDAYAEENGVVLPDWVSGY